jgi:hypothetical protein
MSFLISGVISGRGGSAGAERRTGRRPRWRACTSSRSGASANRPASSCGVSTIVGSSSDVAGLSFAGVSEAAVTIGRGGDGN